MNLDSYERIVDQNFDELKRRLSFHLFNEILPSYFVSQKNFDLLEKFANSKADKGILLYDNYISCRESDLNQVRTSVYEIGGYDIIMKLLKSKYTCFDLDYLIYYDSNFSVIGYINNSTKVAAIIIDVAYDEYEKYNFDAILAGDTSFFVDSYEEGNNGFTTKTMFNIINLANSLYNKVDKIEIILFQEYRMILSNEFTDAYINGFVQRLQYQYNKGILLFDPNRNISVSSTKQFISTNFGEQTSFNFLIKYKQLYSEYLHYFTTDGTGKLLHDYKDVIVESLKESCNYLFGTYFDYDFHKTARYISLKNILDEDQLIKEYESAKININLKNDTLFREIKNNVNLNSQLLYKENVYQAIMSSEWLLNNIGYLKNLDNTYICFGYFKAVEIILYEIINKHYGIKKMSSSNSKAKLHIGEKNDGIRSLSTKLKQGLNKGIFKNEKLILQLDKKINTWRKTYRNGYFHKDTLNSQDVITIRKDSYEIIYMILGI